MTAGGTVLASGVGMVRLKIPNKDEDLVLTDVLYMLLFLVNLFLGVILYCSEGRICGKTSTLRDKQDEVICGVDISADGLFLKAGTFYEGLNRFAAFHVNPINVGVNRRLWHRRLGHLGHRNVQKTASMTKGMLGLKYFESQMEDPLCRTCEMAK